MLGDCGVGKTTYADHLASISKRFQPIYTPTLEKRIVEIPQYSFPLRTENGDCVNFEIHDAAGQHRVTGSQGSVKAFMTMPTVPSSCLTSIQN